MVYDRYKELCKRHRTSPTVVCEKITGSRGNLPTWQKGNIRSDDLKSVSDYFSVSTDYLLGKTDDPTPPGQKTPIDTAGNKDDNSVISSGDVWYIGGKKIRPDELTEEARKDLEAALRLVFKAHNL